MADDDRDVREEAEGALSKRVQNTHQSVG